MKKTNLGFIYLFLPLFFFLYINFSRETDIWFILSHGRYILKHGFPHTEFLTIHEGLHFIMQQWGWSYVIYLLYHYIGSIGVVIFIGLINVFVMFFIYKLCMKICNNSYFSYLLTAIIDLLLELNFVCPRPQMISLLLLLIVIYILERKDKSIILLPIISLLLINFHASMWLMFFIICLPFMAEYILKRDKYIINLLLIMIISFMVGFINPYGIESMMYVFSSYGVNTINKLVGEMHTFSIIGENLVVYNSIQLLLLFLIAVITMVFNYKRTSIHSLLLILGLSIMAFLNIRNIALFLVCAMPYISIIFKNRLIFIQKIKSKYLLVILFTIVLLFAYKAHNNTYKLRDKNMEDVVKLLDKRYDKNKIKIFTDYGSGPYIEYNGYKVYMDTRAEVFIKKNNHKADILEEYYNVLVGKIYYEDFINKYKFNVLIVDKNSNIYNYLVASNNFNTIYNKKNIVVFEKK